MKQLSREKCESQLPDQPLSHQPPLMDSLARLDAVAENGGSTSTRNFDDAAMRVSSFLSESRILAQRAKLCQHTGCAFLCTGIASKFCCKLCAKSPGKHGPKCEKKLLPCSSPGCTFAVTGVSDTHCCKMCAYGKGHGPNCWCLAAEEVACEEVESAGTDAEVSDDQPSGTGLEDPPSTPSSDDGQGRLGASDESDAIDVSDTAEIKALSAKVVDNQHEIDTNAAVIQALRDALGR